VLHTFRGILPNEEFFYKQFEDILENAENATWEINKRSKQEGRRMGRNLRLQEKEYFLNHPEPPSNVS
jgi:hypothetical protein